ncbi:MAG: hypothetical protein MZV63_65610 [Marinilabiliales bacterium]|nr:hypothetical protein [Marinilabiliales bacterium]
MYNVFMNWPRPPQGIRGPLLRDRRPGPRQGRPPFSITSRTAPGSTPAGWACPSSTSSNAT